MLSQHLVNNQVHSGGDKKIARCADARVPEDKTRGVGRSVQWEEIKWIIVEGPSEGRGKRRSGSRGDMAPLSKRHEVSNADYATTARVNVENSLPLRDCTACPNHQKLQGRNPSHPQSYYLWV